jgi:tetratricopeptide (TPR) repeat protein
MNRRLFLPPQFLSLLLFLIAGAVLNAAAQNNPALDEAEAAALAASGRTDQAVELYQGLLQREPDNVSALAEISELLEAKGRWPEAAPFLEHLVQLEPRNASALYRLGRMRSWQSAAQGHDGATLLRRACDASDRNPEYCGAYADLLSWKQETRAEAVSRLREVLSAHPDSAPTRLKLARILSWNGATRPESLRIFDDGLQRDPQNAELLLASAEVLSWRSATWPESIARYDRVLADNPRNAEALTGKAQLLVWRNHSADALALYQQVLETDPKNPAALRGKAEILNRRGLYVEARSLAEQAHSGAPADERADLELARADIGLQKFTAARDALSAVTGSPAPEFGEARQEIRRGLGTYMDLGYDLRKAHRNVDFNRFDVAISSPLGDASRITFQYQPTLYDIQQQNFNTSYFETSLNSQITDRLTTHFQVGAEVFQNAPVAVDGAFGLRFKPVSSTTLHIGFERQPVEESLLSTRGLNVNGSGFLGQVRSNIADAGISYYNTAHKFDSYLDYNDGVFTGHNLESNRRYGVEAGMGKSVRGDKPYIRLGYSVSYLSFDHDADLQTGQPLTNVTGGYFSPTRFLVNQAVLTFAHNFSRNLEWGANGTAGVQNVETSTASFSNSQFASSFETHVLWRFTPMNELRLNYQYLNVFNAFERNLYSFQWRHYF